MDLEDRLGRYEHDKIYKTIQHVHAGIKRYSSYIAAGAVCASAKLLVSFKEWRRDIFQDSDIGNTLYSIESMPYVTAASVLAGSAMIECIHSVLHEEKNEPVHLFDGHLAHSLSTSLVHGCAVAAPSAAVAFSRVGYEHMNDILSLACINGITGFMMSQLAIGALGMVKPNRIVNAVLVPTLMAARMVLPDSLKRNIGDYLPTIVSRDLESTMRLNTLCVNDDDTEMKHILYLQDNIDQFDCEPAFASTIFTKTIFNAIEPLAVLEHRLEGHDKAFLYHVDKARYLYRKGDYVGCFEELDLLETEPQYGLELACIVAGLYADFEDDIRLHPERFEVKGLSEFLKHNTFYLKGQQLLRNSFVEIARRSKDSFVRGDRIITFSKHPYMHQFVFKQGLMSELYDEYIHGRDLASLDLKEISIAKNVGLAHLHGVEGVSSPINACLITRMASGVCFSEIEDLSLYEQAARGIAELHMRGTSWEGLRDVGYADRFLIDNGFEKMVRDPHWDRLKDLARGDPVLRLDSHGFNVFGHCGHLGKKAVTKIDNEDKGYENGLFDVVKLSVQSGATGGIGHLESVCRWYAQSSGQDPQEVMDRTFACLPILAARESFLQTHALTCTAAQKRKNLTVAIDANTQSGFAVLNPYLEQMLETAQ